MKNLKKVLALALAFVMCFTMFAGAAVYTDVPAGSDYSEAVSLLSDLGVIAGKPDGSFGVDETITRADAACLIARLMTGETTPSKYAGASNFVDVAKDAYYESSVAYCAIMGITSGVGGNKYEPLRTITDGEFVAMLTRALGYDTAENPLQFPMGNIAVAQAEGLLDGVNCVANSPALRGEDAQMVYNALFADYDRAAKNNNVYQGADDHADYTIAEEVFNLARLAVAKGDKNSEADFYDRDERDDMTCVSHNWVVAGKDTRDGENEYTAYSILDKNDELNTKSPITFSYDGDAESIMGYEVELWGDVDHTGDDFEVVAVKTVKGQTGVDWNPSMESDGTKMIVDDEKYQTNAAYMPVRNTEKDHGVNSVFTKEKGDAFSLVEKKNIESKYLSVKNGDQYRLCDWDSDGDVDFIIRTQAKYGEVTQLSKSKITLETENGRIALDLDDDNLVIDAEGVEKGDIVEITEADRTWTKSDKEIVEIKLETIESETMELTKVSTSKKLQPYFDGEKLYVADKNVWDRFEADDPDDYDYDEDDVGTDFDLYLNRNGIIIKSAEGDNDSKGYLIVLDTEKGYDGLGSKYEPISIKAMLDDGSVQVFDLDDDDIVKDAEKEDKAGVTTSNGKVLSLDEGKMVGVIYKYYTDSDGVITKLVQATDSVARYGKQESEDASKAYNDNTHVLTVRNADVLVSDTETYKNMDLDTAKVMFVVDKDAITYDKDATQVDFELDEDDVAVISKEDLDDVEVASNSNLVKAGDGALQKHEYVITGANEKKRFAQIAYKVNDDYEAEAFVMAISNFDEIGHSKKAGLVMWAAKNGSVIEVTAAVDGKVDVFECDSKDADDIFENMNLKQAQAAIGGGRYAEITFDADGKISAVDFFEDNTTFNDKYTVERVVVGNKVSTKYLSKYDVSKDKVYFEDDETLYMLDTLNWKTDSEYDDDAFFYTLGTEPGIYGVDEDNYKGKELKASNGFVLDSIYDRDKDKYKVEVGSVDDVVKSDIKSGDGDIFNVVDIILKDGDIIATYIFDSMKSTNEKIDTDDFAAADVTVKGDDGKTTNVYEVDFTGKATANGNVKLTYNDKTYEVPVKENDTAAYIADQFADKMNAEFGKSKASAEGGVLKITAQDADSDFDWSGTVTVDGITMDLKKVVKDETKASTKITVSEPSDKKDLYKVESETEIEFENEVKVTIPAGNYTADEIASMIKDQLENALDEDDVKVSVKDNVVTVTGKNIEKEVAE